MASQGYRVEPHGVTRIRRGNSNETMWSWRERGERQRVIDERPLRYMNYMMTRVVEAGTGTRARINGRQIGGKTGTGNDYRDAWFVGFTPGIVTGVWVGNDNFTETARVTGGSLPADIWARFMPIALRNVPIRELAMPRPEDYDIGVPDRGAPELAAVGAPLGGTAPAAALRTKKTARWISARKVELARHANGVQPAAMLVQPGAAAFIIRDGALTSAQKRREWFISLQMRDFVRGEIIQHEGRRQHHAPRERQRPVHRARTPARARSPSRCRRVGRTPNVSA